MAYKINEFSKISGVPAPNLRFYEMKGYPEPKRTDNGYRQYELEDVYRINTFNMLVAEGFSIAEAAAWLDYHTADEYCTALEEKNEKIQKEIWLLEKKLQWNRKMQYVYSHLEHELSISRTVDLPEMVFLKCSENNNLQESYRNSKKISQWVRLLPAALYTVKQLDFKYYELGMVLERKTAEKYQLMEEDLTILPAGEYFCMLARDSEELRWERQLQQDRRVVQYLKEGGVLEDLCIYRIYLMAGEKKYGEFLNYILIKKGKL